MARKRTCKHPAVRDGKQGKLAGMTVIYQDCMYCNKPRISYRVIGRAK